ncbi:MAG TPA: abortive infection family protein [Clostridiales bacterium]|nr:abortive infection family protein [Clostridiales bacterium]HQP70274.1 abortive infection family protein [Clostridiales bacterium]
MNIDVIIEMNLEALLIDRGVVLNFSNNDMRKFIIKSIGLDVYAAGFDAYGESKANRLRYVWNKYTEEVVSKLNIDLLRYFKKISSDELFQEKKEEYEECMKYFEKMLNKRINIAETGISKKLNDDILSHKFISEQILKSNMKIEGKDYSGAITNARSLVEQVLMELASRYEHEIKNKGDLLKLYNEIAKAMNLQAANYDIEGFKQILSGLNSIVNGISNLRNELSDAHARKYEPSRHHARLAINSANTICEFLLDSYEHQIKMKEKGKL